MKGWKAKAAIAVLSIFLSLTCRFQYYKIEVANAVGDHYSKPAAQKASSSRPNDIEARVATLLSRMNITDMIGQMAQIDLSVASASRIQTFRVGSVVNAFGSQIAPRATPRMWANMIDRFQNTALQSALGIPIIYGTFAIHGNANLYGATVFPHNIGLGATRDAELVRHIGVATAKEMKATAMHLAFTPSLAICSNPKWRDCYQTFGEDPELVREMTELIAGLQGVRPLKHTNGYPYIDKDKGVIACAKSFVGDGSASETMYFRYIELFQDHLRQYLEALAKGVSVIVTSSVSFNGVKVRESKELLTELLKNQMGFQGIVLADWEDLEHTATDFNNSNYRSRLAAAVNAGVDMITVPYDIKSFVGNLTGLVQNGTVPKERITDATRRILRVKLAAGLFENPKANRSLISTIGSQAHRSMAREAVRKSMVLLKNGKMGWGPLLPLSKNVSRILVAGSHAQNLLYQSGRASLHSIAGTTILEGIQMAVGAYGTKVVYTSNSNDPYFYETMGDVAYGIVVVGEFPYDNRTTAGVENDLKIPLDGVGVIKTVCGRMPCCVVVVSGSIMFVDDVVDDVDALVAAWLPGSEGNGISDVLFGDYDFTGRLPLTWLSARNVSSPLFPFGFGLSMRSPHPSSPASALW